MTVESVRCELQKRIIAAAHEQAMTKKRQSDEFTHAVKRRPAAPSGAFSPPPSPFGKFIMQCDPSHLASKLEADDDELPVKPRVVDKSVLDAAHTLVNMCLAPPLRVPMRQSEVLV